MSLPALSVPVPVAPMTAVAVLLFISLSIHVSFNVTQRCAAETTPHVGFNKLACIHTARVSGFLMVMVVVVAVASCTTAVVNILPSILLIQWHLTRLGLVGVVVAIVLWVYYQGSV